jgi:hypothetical protein
MTIRHTSVMVKPLLLSVPNYMAVRQGLSLPHLPKQTRSCCPSFRCLLERPLRAPPSGIPAASPPRRRAQTWCSLFVAPCALQKFSSAAVCDRSAAVSFRFPSRLSLAGSPLLRQVAPHSMTSSQWQSVNKNNVERGWVASKPIPFQSLPPLPRLSHQ